MLEMRVIVNLDLIQLTLEHRMENQFEQQEIVNPELDKSAPEEIWNGNGMFIFKFVIYCKVLL